MIPLVTLCGSYNLKFDWVKPCIDSWSNITAFNPTELHLIPDERLDEADALCFKNMGFTLHNSDSTRDQLEKFLDPYPALKQMRKKDLTWRKLLDTAIIFREHEKVILIDTDVLVTKPVLFPSIDCDFMYMLEDIPAYRGHWSITFKEPMVPAFNAGLVMFHPLAVNFEFLEYLTKKFILGCKDYWWSEQLAWACLAGRTESRFVFDGQQTRVASGFKKRTPQEVLNNSFNYFGKKGTIENFESFFNYVDGAAIIHFAGLGKKWFSECKKVLDEQNRIKKPVTILPYYNDPLLTLKDKLLISTRLFIKELI